MNNILTEECSYRLPCGICLMTNKQCPKMPCKIEPITQQPSSWTNTTVGEGTITVNAMNEVQGEKQ